MSYSFNVAAYRTLRKEKRSCRISRTVAEFRVSRRLIACAFACAMVLPAASWAVDWGKTAAAEVSLFYPGQMSWEKVLTASAHKGATKFRAGETCHACHRDEEAEMGASQAQLTGFVGRNAVTVQLRAAVQGDSLHLQMSGPAVDGKAPSVGDHAGQ